jgi:hypothetical protein
MHTMLLLRHAFKIFLLLTVVLALAVPLSTSQDNTKSDDSSSQSDRSDDQQCDQSTPGDFIFEQPSIFCKKLPHEVFAGIILTPSESRLFIRISSAPSFHPHIFISACGLRPRAPSLA